MAGYSGKPLRQKLGIKPGLRVCFYHAPPGYRKLLGTLPREMQLVTQGGSLDFIQYFGVHRQAFASALPGLKARIKPNGAIWISWPKRASKVTTDLDENVVRHLAQQQGLVDVKVVAVDDVWSALKLVIPCRRRA